MRIGALFTALWENTDDADDDAAKKVLAGRYTFLDYMKLGLPVQALMGVFMVYVLPLLFPFAG